MRPRYRRNPPQDAAFAIILPIIPWVAAGTVLYFYGGTIFNWISAKISGKSIEQIKADTATVAAAVKSPFTASKEIIQYVTGTTGYISPAEQAAAIAKVKADLKAKAPIKTYKVPYPNPQSQAEFKANIAAIKAAMDAAKA